MKNPRLLPVLALSSVLFTSCGSRPGTESGRNSQLAEIGIGVLNLPNWDRFDLKLERLRPEPEIIPRNYPRGADNDIHDITVQVPLGDYKILMTYKDAQGKILYESCAADKAKEHSIQVARYAVEIQICPVNDQTPALPKEPGPTVEPVITPSPAPE